MAKPYGLANQKLCYFQMQRIEENYREQDKKSSFNPFSKRQMLDSSNLKEFADDNFEFDENGRKFSKRVENTEGKGEIARYEQFLVFPQCFQKTCTPDT